MTTRLRSPRFLAVVLAAALLGMAGPASASSPIEIEAGTGELVHLPEPATKVFIADPEVADVQVSSDTTVFLVARKPGSTTLIAVNGAGREILHGEVHVKHNTRAAEEQIRALYPQYAVTVRSAIGRVILTGAVATAADAATIAGIVKGQIGDKDEIVNQMTITSSTQVNLKVRIAEISRTLDNEFGVNWKGLFSPGAFTFNVYTGRNFTTTGSSGSTAFAMASSGAGSYLANFTSGNGRVNLTTVIDALDSEGLARVLAEPNLTAVSGQSATFLAGGEVPIPVAQTNANGGTGTISVTFKKVGVQLTFTPTVLAPDRISLRVKPEVSEVSENLGITTGDITIPGFTTRQIETTVELGSGQSFAIAGLMNHTTSDTLSKLPGLGDLPVLGALFRSTSFSSSESELIVVVTPFLVKPTVPENIPTPLDDLRPASQLERIIAQRMTREGGHAGPGGMLENGARLRGDAGFIY
jgi:pilus assembly protein CpaC